MTTPNQARESVYDRIRTLWTQTVYQLEGNLGFSDGNRKSPDGAPWVRVAVRNRGGGQETLGRIGSRRYWRKAAVIGQVFVPTGDGLQENDTLAKTFLDLFEGATFSSLFFNDGEIREIGPPGSEQQFNVEIEFSYQERK